MWKTIKEQPEKTFLIQIWNYYKPIIRGTKQSRTVQGHQLSRSANRGLLRTSQ
jgi:hypothetical protein